MIKIIVTFCISFLLSLSAWASACKVVADVDIIGSAYDKKGEKLYCEYHFSDNEGNTSVRYINNDGELIAKKQVVAGPTPQRPSVRQLDYRSGELRSAEVIARDELPDEVQVDYVKNKDAEKRNFSVSTVPNLVIDAGFDYAIRESLPELDKGERLRFKFLSLVNGKSYSLSVKKTRLSRCTENANGEQYQCFSVKPANSIAKLLVTPIYLLYDVSEKKLLKFSGQVNILDDEGKSQWAMINYQHFK